MIIAENNSLLRYALIGVQAVLLFALGFLIFRSVVAAVSPDSLWTSVQVSQADTQSNPVSEASNENAFDFDPFHRETVAVVVEAKPEIDAPETTLNLKLTGFRSVDGEGSAVIKTPDGAEKTYLTGEEIISGVTLKSVFPGYVVLSRSGASERLTFANDKRKSVIGSADDTTDRRSQNTTNPPDPPAVSGRKKPSASDFLSSVSLKRQMDSGTVTGYEITKRRPNFDLDRYGLKSGDVVTHILDQDIRQGTGQLRQLLNRLGTVSNAEIRVIRDGQEITVRTQL